jgi:hypothetical protein
MRRVPVVESSQRLMDDEDIMRLKRDVAIANADLEAAQKRYSAVDHLRLCLA